MKAIQKSALKFKSKLVVKHNANERHQSKFISPVTSIIL